MKKYRVLFWITAAIMILWFGIGPITAYDNPESVGVLLHLGYPVYFSLMLTCFKVLGVLAIVIPKIPNRVKEWAYAGFAIDLLCAMIGFIIIDGFIPELLLPATALIIVILNYVSFDTLRYRAVNMS